MITITLVLATSLFSFEGGDATLLAPRIREARKSSVAILLADDPKLRKFAFKWDTPTEFNQNVTRLSQLKHSGDDCAFYPSAWPEYMFESSLFVDRAARPRGLQFEPWPVRDGEFYISKANGLHRLGDLQEVEAGITVHPFLKDAVIAFSGSGKIAEVLPVICKAVGATIAESNNGSKISVDATAYKSRMLATLIRRENVLLSEQQSPPLRTVMREGKAVQVPVTRDPFHLTDTRVAVAALRGQVGTQQIARSFETGDGEIRLSVPKSGALAGAVMNRLNAYAERRDLVMGEGAGSLRDLVGSIDLDRPISVIYKVRSGRTAVSGWLRGYKDRRITF